MHAAPGHKLAAGKQKAMQLMAAGKLAEALKLAGDLCRRHASDAETHYILGAVHGTMEQFDQAAASFRRCIALQPGVFAAHLNLGQACTGMQAFEQAVAAYRAALELQPGDPDTRALLAGVLAELGSIDEAEDLLQTVIAGNPGHAIALDTLGDIYRARKLYPEAIGYYRRALHAAPGLAAPGQSAPGQSTPGQADTLFHLGNCLLLSGKSDSAADYFQQVVDVNPGHLAARVHLGHCHKQNGKPEAARAAYEDALRIEPGNLTATVGLIDLYEREGRFDDAWARLLPLVERGDIEVDLAAAFVRLCHRYGACDEAIAYAGRVLAGDGIAADDIARLEYALGRKLDQAGDYDEAFTHYRRANELRPQAYDPHAHAAFIDQLIETFDWPFFTRAPRATAASERPVFIVGMPRSGTSLTEQILASHPEVYGAGELTLIGDAVQGLLAGRPPYPAAMRDITAEQLDAIAGDYLAHVDALAGSAARVTDKQPTNFLHLGLIALAFPGARIIHCTRDPMDNCLSIYFQAFSDANNYAGELEHIGQYYRQYRRWMRHIGGLLGIPVLDLAYESLVDDQEAMTRSLLDFVGLPWDERCLAFHENRRFVATPSYDQVRERIYTSAVQRWKHYDKHLEPLQRALDAG